MHRDIPLTRNSLDFKITNILSFITHESETWEWGCYVGQHYNCLRCGQSVFGLSGLVGSVTVTTCSLTSNKNVSGMTLFIFKN